MARIALHYDSQYYDAPDNIYFIGTYKVGGIPRVGEFIDLTLNDYKWDFEVTAVGYELVDGYKLAILVYVQPANAPAVD